MHFFILFYPVSHSFPWRCKHIPPRCNHQTFVNVAKKNETPQINDHTTGSCLDGTDLALSFALKKTVKKKFVIEIPFICMLCARVCDRPGAQRISVRWSVCVLAHPSPLSAAALAFALGMPACMHASSSSSISLRRLYRQKRRNGDLCADHFLLPPPPPARS